MKTPDLMFGCLGNGITVCDRTREESGDYKTVAHIDNCGAVKFYDHSLPEESVQRIWKQARGQVETFKADFLRLPRAAALDRMYSRMNTAQMCARAYTGTVDMTMDEIYQAYIRYECQNSGYTMQQAERR